MDLQNIWVAQVSSKLVELEYFASIREALAENSASANLGSTGRILEAWELSEKILHYYFAINSLFKLIQLFDWIASYILLYIIV